MKELYMLITMLSTGTRGDTQPFIALGLELKKKGYRVRIAASKTYRDLVEGYGFEFASLRGDVNEILESGLVKESDSPLKFFTSLNFKNEDLQELMIGGQEDLHKACEGSDAIVYHPGATIGYFVAQEMGIPSILASPFPMTPTKEYPAIIFYDRMRMGKLYNKLTHTIFEKGFWKMASGGVKRYWMRAYGELPQGFSNPYPKQRTDSHPTLVSLSPTVFPVPTDWPHHVHSYGYWFIEETSDYIPPVELANFLKEGPAPLYIGFGSVGDKKNASKATNLVLSALEKTGMRAVINAGAGMEERNNTKNVLFIKGAPHEWLFPHMAAVIHHGGAGTTAAALRSGVPQIVIPFGNDQYAWGRRMYELGVASQAIPRKKLTIDNLVNAIQDTQNEQIIAKAKELGEIIRSEKGAEKSANLIDQTLKSYYGNKKRG